MRGAAVHSYSCFFRGRAGQRGRCLLARVRARVRVRVRVSNLSVTITTCDYEWAGTAADHQTIIYCTDSIVSDHQDCMRRQRVYCKTKQVYAAHFGGSCHLTSSNPESNKMNRPSLRLYLRQLKSTSSNLNSQVTSVTYCMTDDSVCRDLHQLYT